MKKMAKEVQCYDDAECIRVVPMFQNLNEDVVQLIKNIALMRDYEKGEFLYRQGDKDDVLYMSKSGNVKVYRLTADGKEQVIRILNPGDFLGEWTLFAPEERHTTYAEVLKDTHICLIKREDMQELLDRHPQISQQFMQEMSKQLRAKEQQQFMLGMGSIEERLVYFIEGLVDMDEGAPYTVDINMTRRNLASYIGTTPETISRLLGRLEDSGRIRQLSSQTLEIPDLDALIL